MSRTIMLAATPRVLASLVMLSALFIASMIWHPRLAAVPAVTVAAIVSRMARRVALDIESRSAVFVLTDEEDRERSGAFADAFERDLQRVADEHGYRGRLHFFRERR